MNVGVIGGSGFIGSHVVDKLVDGGHRVTVLDIMTPHRPDVRHIHMDIVDLSKSVVALTGYYDAVYLLAAMANVNDVFRNPVEAGQINITAVTNVLEAARRNQIGRVVLASTVWLYDMSDQTNVDESTPLNPALVKHVYTASKLAAESLCWAYARMYNVPITILRYGIPYGPRARAGTVLANFVQRALAGQPLLINGTGAATRNYIYVEDLALGNVAALQDAGRNQIFNLEGQEPVSVVQLAEIVKRFVGDVKIEFKESREGDFAGRRVVADKAKRELGWTPKVGIEEGVRRYVEWFKSQP